MYNYEDVEDIEDEAEAEGLHAELLIVQVCQSVSLPLLFRIIKILFVLKSNYISDDFMLTHKAELKDQVFFIDKTRIHLFC